MVGIIVVMAGGDLVMVTIAFPIVAVVLLFVIFRVVIKNYEHIKLSFYGDGIFLSAAAVGVYNVAYRVVFILSYVCSWFHCVGPVPDRVLVLKNSSNLTGIFCLILAITPMRSAILLEFIWLSES